MTAPSPSNEELLRLEQAADWVQALSRNRLDDRLVESWLEWCGRDPRNKQAFEGLATIWAGAANLPPPGARIHPEVADATGSGQRFARGRWRAALAASVLIAACAALLLWALPRGGGDDQAQSVISPTGVHSTSQLPDGSVMDLGGRTSVKLLYSAAVRRVDMLDGEVYLTVSKDKNRAFVVTAGPVRVTAVGTAFNVRRDAGRVVVTVSEGAVDVARTTDSSTDSCAASDDCVRLMRGQQLAYASSAKAFKVSSVDPGIAMSWRAGVLKFVDEPLCSVVASVNRYSPRTIRIRDKDLETLAFTGTVHPDRIDRWLRALEKAFPLAVVEAGDKDVTLVARP
jgi:transmembrane sensor